MVSALMDKYKMKEPMNRVKIIKILVVVVGVVLVVGGAFLIFRNKGTGRTVNKLGNVGENIRDSIPDSIIPRAKINVGGVEVNDFTKNRESINSQGDFLAVKEANYEIVYFPNGDYFNISVLASPFDTWRGVAEAKLLSRLGVNEKEACQLNVVVTTPLFVNPDEAGNQYPLSFCN